MRSVRLVGRFGRPGPIHQVLCLRWGRSARSVRPVDPFASPDSFEARVSPLGLVGPLPPARFPGQVGPAGRSGGRVGPVRPQGVCKGGAAGMLQTLCLQSVLCEWPVGGTGPSPRCPISLIPCHRKPHTHPSCHLLEAPCPVTADSGDLTGVEPVDDKVLFGCTLDGVAGLEAHRCEFGNGRVVHSHPWFSMRSAPGARAWFRLAQHS